MEICYSCGASEIYEDGLCKKCFVKRNPLLLQIKPQKIVFCRLCGEIKYRMKTFHLPKDNIKFLSELKKSIKANKNIYESVKLEFNLDNLIQNQVVDVVASSKDIVQKQVIVFIISNSLCQICRKKGSEFYSVLIQLRGFDEETINSTLKNYNQYILKIEKEKKGANLFFIDSKKAEKYIALFIEYHKSKNAPINIKTSKKNDGIDQSGKKRYKTTVLLQRKV